MRGTNKHTETQRIHFDIHGGLSQSGENTCMGTHGKDGTTSPSVWRHLYCVFTYIYSPLIKKTSVSVETYQLSFCAFFFVSLHGRFPNFSRNSFPFLFSFSCYSYFSIFRFHVVTFLKVLAIL